MDNITAITEMLSEEVARKLVDEHTLSDIEQMTRRLVQEIGRQVVALVVNLE